MPLVGLNEILGEIVLTESSWERERRIWEKEVKVSQRGVSGMCFVLVLIPVHGGKG